MTTVNEDGIKSFYAKLYDVDPENVEFTIDENGVAHVNIYKKLDTPIRMIQATYKLVKESLK